MKRKNWETKVLSLIMIAALIGSNVTIYAKEAETPEMTVEKAQLQKSDKSEGIPVNMQDAESGLDQISSTGISQKVEQDGITYTYNIAAKTYQVSDCDTNITKAVIASQVEGIEVTRIHNNAFSKQNNLTSIEIPSSITSIQFNSFNECDNLEYFDVDSKNTAYSSIDGVLYNKEGTALVRCPQAKKGVLDISDKVTAIKEWACYMCINLTSVNIPEGAAVIEDQAFAWCSGLKNFTISSNNKNYSSVEGILCDKKGKDLICFPAGKGGAVKIPAGIQTIYERAFNGCADITEIVIPKGTERIGYYSFANCKSLTTVVLPEGVTYMDDNAFSGCTALTKINFPQSLSYIGFFAFEGCTGLKEIMIPDGITEICRGAFTSCTNLTKAVILSNTVVLGKELFIGAVNLTIYGNKNSTVETYAIGNNIPFSYFEKPAVTCIVTFDPDGGTLSEKVRSVSEGTAIGTLPLCSREGYTFKGWFTARSGGTKVLASTVIEKSRTLYAQWNINKYTVKFDKNGGKNLSIKSVTVDYNQKIGKLPSIERLGYSFQGWYTKKSGGSRISKGTKITQNQTLYARWKKVGIYTVKFDKNGEMRLTKTKLQITKNGRITKLPSVQRKGYCFKGWYTKKSGGRKVSNKTIIKSDQTLYARWSKVIKPKKCGVPAVKSGKRGEMTVGLKKAAGADGYEILYSSSKKFSGGTTKVSSVTTLKKVIHSLKKGKIYYVKVRAYKVDSAGNKIYGDYSKTKKIKIRS